MERKMTMQKTPETRSIKRGLECCYGDSVLRECDKCPYASKYLGNDIFHVNTCDDNMESLGADALALIQQLQDDNAEKGKSMQQLERSLSFVRDLADGLKAATVKQEQELYVSEERNRQLEAQNAELLEKVEQLQAERDAAVADLAHVKDCDTCKYDNACLTGKKDCFVCHEKSCPCLTCKYEWRGVQKEETT
jgi:hypothetical protein